MTFFNTNSETGQGLKESRKKAATQDEKILDIALFIGEPFSTKDIYNKYPDNKTPITSIRRALNTLKVGGFIQETGVMVQGIYGKSERQYKVC